MYYVLCIMYYNISIAYYDPCAIALKTLSKTLLRFFRVGELQYGVWRVYHMRIGGLGSTLSIEFSGVCHMSYGVWGMGYGLGYVGMDWGMWVWIGVCGYGLGLLLIEWLRVSPG
jgi:hypothetical protein